jgi:glycosyltransferase EpsE
MSSNPSVSFIMGVYRCKDINILIASVKSIISQTYEDWEMLIVDDGSTDGGVTSESIKKAAALDHRIIPLSYQQNHGLAYALDYCLERARGQYIARQDDDDVSEPERLVREVSFLEKHPEYTLVGTNAALFDDNGIWGSLDMPEYPDKKSFLWNSPFIHPSTLMSADALRSVGGYRNAPETLLYEDYDLFMRMYAAGMRGANIQEHLYRYRSDRNTSKPRSLTVRFREAKVRSQGFKALGLGAAGIPYVIKPIALGLVPKRLYGAMQARRSKR